MLDHTQKVFKIIQTYHKKKADILQDLKDCPTQDKYDCVPIYVLTYKSYIYEFRTRPFMDELYNIIGQYRYEKKEIQINEQLDCLPDYVCYDVRGIIKTYML